MFEKITVTENTETKIDFKAVHKSSIIDLKQNIRKTAFGYFCWV
jgi:hypothetical protein